LASGGAVGFRTGAPMKNNKTGTLTLPGGRDAPARESGRVSGFERWLAAKALEAAGQPPLALVLWNGEELRTAAEPVARILVRERRAFYQLLRNPALHFGDLYAAGRLEVEGDLVECLGAAYAGMADNAAGSLLKRLQTRSEEHTSELQS